MADFGICSADVVALSCGNERVKDGVMCTAGWWMRYYTRATTRAQHDLDVSLRELAHSFFTLQRQQSLRR